MVEKIKRLIQFITVDIWRIKLDSLPKSKSRLIRQLQVLIIAFRGFNEDKCMLRASALTFYSMLSFVPVLAMIFGISKGFGLEKRMHDYIMNIEGYNYEVLQKVAEFAETMLSNTKGGLVAGIGLLVLFWSVMKVLGNIEASFNDIWEIKNQRSLSRKFSDYLSIILVAPVLLIVSTSITGYITSLIQYVFESMSFLDFMMPVVEFFLRFIPYLLIWVLLLFLYMMMPNTRVNFKSALAAGIIAGTMFQVAEVFYFYFQFGVAKYNAIYGSFAALPLFLIWLQTSWIIVLFGAEISFAHQNVSRFEFEADAKNISNRYRKELSLLLMHHIAVKFKKAEPPSTATELSRSLSIPIRLLRILMNDLINAGLISELNSDDHKKEITYQPARDVRELTVQKVMELLDTAGSDDIPVQGEKELISIQTIYKGFNDLLANSNLNKNVTEI